MFIPCKAGIALTSAETGMAGKGQAFVKGGCGCLVAFLAIGVFFVLIGGTMYIDPGGAILLFVIGGVIGLIVRAIYNRGARDAQAGTSNQPYQPYRAPTDAPDFKALNNQFDDSDGDTPW